MLNNGTASTPEKSPWMQPGFIAAAAVVALLVLLGLILAVTGGSNGDTKSGAANPAPAPPAAPSGQNADASTCGLAAGNQTIPKAAPAATWKLRGTVAVPTSPRSFGPGAHEGDVPACFAHSPSGALFATINIDAALGVASAGSSSEQVRVLKQVAATGPGRDAAIKSARQNGPATDSSSGAQVAGFSITRYESASAVIDLAFRADRPGATGYFHLSSTVRWEGGDWKLVFSQAGDPFDSTQQIPSLSGYIPWSGV